MDNHGLFGVVAGNLIEKIEVVKKPGLDGMAGLNFDGMNFSTCVDDQVNFVAGFVPPKIKRLDVAPVVEVLHNFGYYKIFEQSALGIVGFQLLSRSYSQQIASEAGVIKIKFWGFC
jgi:hypothetical protein